MATRLPYDHSPEADSEEGEQQPWTIHCPLTEQPEDWEELRPGVRFRRVEAQPDDPMFGRLHVAFLSAPKGVR
jgi:hypothetical protein